MTPDGRFLLAVNSGSNDVSVFAVTRNGLRLVDRSSTHGEFPVSIAMHQRTIYVLNFGGLPTLQGVLGTPTRPVSRLGLPASCTTYLTRPGSQVILGPALLK